MKSFVGAMSGFVGFGLVAVASVGCQPSPDSPSPPAPIADPAPPTSASATNAPPASASLCTTGQDQSCNENPAMNSLHGKCTAQGTCECIAPFTKASSGRCN